MKEDMKKKYDEMYQTHLVEGKNKEVMVLWGEMTCDFVYEIMEKYPEYAEKYVMALETAIEAKDWHNYLSHHEMKEILEAMSPKAKWSYDDVVNACKSYGVVVENKPYWNTCSLVVTMNMVNSDHHETLSAIAKTNEEYVALVYNLAVDKLQDADKMFNIRRYFQSIINKY